MRKGQSVVLAFFFIFIIALLLLIPFLFYYSSATQIKEIDAMAYENYQYLKQLQLEQIESGHPTIIYNGYGLIVNYTALQGLATPLNNLTIAGILYYNSTYNAWINITPLAVYMFKGTKLVGVIGHEYSFQQGMISFIPSTNVHILESYTNTTYEVTYPLVIGIPGYVTVVQLPPYIEGKPIILDTVIGNGSTYYPGNLFYLTPNGKIGVITKIPHSTPFQYTFNILTDENSQGSPQTVVQFTPSNAYAESPSLASPLTGLGGYAVTKIPYTSQQLSQYNTLVITLVYDVNGNLEPNNGYYYGVPGVVIYPNTLSPGEPDNNVKPVAVFDPLAGGLDYGPGIYLSNPSGVSVPFLSQQYEIIPYSYGLIQITLENTPQGVEVVNVTQISPETNYFGIYSSNHFVYNITYNMAQSMPPFPVILPLNWNSMQYIGIRLVGFNISVLYFTYQFY